MGGEPPMVGGPRWGGNLDGGGTSMGLHPSLGYATPSPMGLHPSLGYATPSGLVCGVMEWGEVFIPRKRGKLDVYIFVIGFPGRTAVRRDE
jgi:hypothetical protein